MYDFKGHFCLLKFEWDAGLHSMFLKQTKRTTGVHSLPAIVQIVKCSIKALRLHTHLKFVIWFSRRTRNRSLISSKRSFSSTVTVPRPSGLFYKQNMPLFANWLGRKINFEPNQKKVLNWFIITTNYHTT